MSQHRLGQACAAVPIADFEGDSAGVARERIRVITMPPSDELRVMVTTITCVYCWWRANLPAASPGASYLPPAGAVVQ